MKIGAKVPNSGPLPAERGVGAMAKALEEAGFDSLWVSDHIVMPASIESRYPFAADGKASWPTDTPYLDAMVSMAVIAAVTTRARIGTAVLVLPLRHPVELAKQAASIDMMSGGRLVLGVGAGWLSEEFHALDVPFDSRGRRFVEWIEILRNCWTGVPEPFEGEFYTLPRDVLVMPAPEHEIPLLVGGHSRVARARAATFGSGWLAQQSAEEIDSGEIAKFVAEMRTVKEAAGASMWTTLRLVDSVSHRDQVVRHLPFLRDAGVDEVIIDVDWNVNDSAAETFGLLANAAIQ